ncbi:MAG: amino acid synthesis family protein [Gulosibacter sp.]|uniref:amino acid synthesis family protein n=1 Tax=Gulosibacter sp. TaxID=2817531 RepID=UPI003F8E618B
MSDLRTLTLTSGEVKIRKTVRYFETVNSDGHREVEEPIHRVIVGAVIENPYAGRYDEELVLLQEAGEALGDWLMREAIDLLPGEVKAYGKAGVVGEYGELEHIAAILHPRFGKPTRSLVEGISILPSVKKRGSAGCTVDVPVHHKTAMLVRDYFDSVSVVVPDAPMSNEILALLAVTDGPRPHPRMGGLQESEMVGEDGLR